MKKFIILIIGLSVSSCIFGQELSNKGKDFLVEESLKRENYVIPDSLFSFFPDRSDKYEDLKIGLIYANAEKIAEGMLSLYTFSPTEIMEIYQCENKELLQQLQKEYYSQMKATIKSESNDYFIVGREEELTERYDTLQLKKNYLEAGNRIVFSFKKSAYEIPALSDPTTIIGLPIGYEILMLKSGNNAVLPENYLYEWSVLPEHLKHGYRSGVAFKEGEPYIIYWTIAW